MMVEPRTQATIVLQLMSPTYDGRAVGCAGQQVVHDEQEDGVAQDEGHLEGGAVHAVGGQQEAEEVHGDEEAAGDQEVHHIEGWPASQKDLGRRR